MNYEELFIDADKLPKPLSKDEIYQCIKEYNQGNLAARDKIVVHNIRLVLKRVFSRFSNTPFDKKELVAIGVMELLDCIDDFDITRGFEFSTYAIKRIDIRILLYLRNHKKEEFEISFDAPIATDEDGNEKSLGDFLEDDSIDFVLDYENQIIYKEIRNIISTLPNREKEIILMYFGFYDGQLYTQSEIANKFNLAQSYVSRIIKKIVNNIKIQLEEKDFIDVKRKNLKC